MESLASPHPLHGSGIFLSSTALASLSPPCLDEVLTAVGLPRAPAQSRVPPTASAHVSALAPVDSTGFAQFDGVTIGRFMRTVSDKSRKLLRAFTPEGRATPAELTKIGGYGAPEQLRGFLSGMTRHVPTVLKVQGEFWRWRAPQGNTPGYYYVSDATRDALNIYFSAHPNS